MIKLHLHPFCFWGSKILLIETRWAGNVAHMWENRRAKGGGVVSWGNRWGGASQKNVNVDGDIKMDHKQQDGSGVGLLS